MARFNGKYRQVYSEESLNKDLYRMFYSYQFMSLYIYSWVYVASFYKTVFRFIPAIALRAPTNKI